MFARRCPTVCNRSQPSPRLLYGRAYGKFSRRDHFWRFPTSRCFVLCGRRNTFATFSKDSEDALQFSWQAQHFGHSHFAWQAQHFRRVVLLFFANPIGSAASSGDKVQIPWQAWHFVRCAEN